MKFVIGTIPLLFLSKILERSIKLLFETRDISQVKQFVQRQCVKVLDGRASVQDLTFAKEYRGGASYRPGACVPALELTRCVVCFCAYGIQKKKARRRVDFSTISIYRQRRTPHGGMPIGSLSDPIRHAVLGSSGERVRASFHLVGKNTSAFAFAFALESKKKSASSSPAVALNPPAARCLRYT